MDEANRTDFKQRTVDEILENVELVALNFGLKADKKIQEIITMLEVFKEYEWEVPNESERYHYLANKKRHKKSQEFKKTSKLKFLPKRYFVLSKDIKIEWRPKPDGTKTYRDGSEKINVKELIHIKVELDILETNLLNLIALEKLHQV